MKIKVSELRHVTNLLLDHLERSGHLEVEFTEDFYWSIPEDRLYAVYDEPTGFTVGQLSDDWEELRQIGSGQKPPVGYGLVWLSSLLRRIGSKIIA
ncbi:MULTISPECIES: hypothetical protein [Myxococcus]|uniref:hypothetical protein n=1 Tax=Myxococcus TaxID=32 RepID=UPI0013D2AC20|nr:hypothetical protein [Myxococcus eversor]NVJ23906.1 hypothetical protein [Myxococcus sp. AM011]